METVGRAKTGSNKMSVETRAVPVKCVTPGEGHYWFGYYDKFPWDASGRYLLAMRAAFADRPPTGEEPAALGLVDLENGCRFEQFAETTAWCWQQGCMLQWLPQAPDRLVLYNDREGDRFVTRIRDLKSGETRTLPRSTYCVSRDGRTALCVNHARLAVTRPGYGYPGLPDEFADELAPEKDGVFRLKLETGESEQILSTAEIAAFEHLEEMDGVEHWLNHLQFNTNDSRFVFLHRYRRAEGKGHISRLMTAEPDGSNLYHLCYRKASHFDWRDEKRLLCYARVPGTGTDELKTDLQFILFTDLSKHFEIIGRKVLTPVHWSDGHCSYSPDRRWILNDTYPDQGDHKRTLMLYDPAKNRRIDIGRFLSPPEFGADMRCDLHPRWSCDGRQVCFDSVHEGARKMYVADVSSVIVAN